VSDIRSISRADILDPATYAKDRKDLKRQISEIKRNRRVEVGPYCTFYFENYATMWHQIHEMLYIERGGEAQIADELAAYNPLIPQGSELIATVMFEIEDPIRRNAELFKLGGIENHIYLSVDGERIAGLPDPTRENTSEDGKASAVQFLRFPFTPTQKAAFTRPGAQILCGIDHPKYGHIAVIPEPVKAALAQDFV
jgi:Protein of unknown function (DUF3501)